MTVRTLIAGGGTGGHLFPALALADELRVRDPAGAVLFVGTARGLETRLVPERGYGLELIGASGLKGVGSWARLRGLLRLPAALVESLRILRRFRPDVVVGVGGYASGPVVLAAWLSRRPTLIAEQNAWPGFTNRVLGRLADVVCVAFDGASRCFARRKVRLTGNPVRREIGVLSGGPRGGTAPPSGAGGPPTVLVFGGSQGARALNELAGAALVRLVRGGRRIRIIHQSGAAHEDDVRALYAGAGVEADVRPFIHDMAVCYQAADVVVCRAGATTVAELCAVGRAAILVPFPHAVDDHQWWNAVALRDAGAALVCRQEHLSESVLGEMLQSLLGDPDRRQRMSEAMRRYGRPDAAARIVEECQHLVARRCGSAVVVP